MTTDAETKAGFKAGAAALEAQNRRLVKELETISEQYIVEVSVRQQVEAALQDSEERFNVVIESANDGVWDLNVAKNEMYISSHWKRMLGYEDHEIENHPDAIEKLIHPDDAAGVSTRLTQHLDGETPIFQTEVRVRCKDGSYRWMLLRGSSVKDVKGDPYRMVIAINDITEIKRAEAIEHEQRVLVEALLDTAVALNSTLEFKEVLESIITNVGRVVPHDASSVVLVERDTDATYVADYQSVLAENLDVTGADRVSVEDMHAYQKMVETGMPVIIPDIQKQEGWQQIPKTEALHSYVGAPVFLSGEVIGFLNLFSMTPDFFTFTHAERLQAFAGQAAIAIHNAHLYEQAQELAALEERQRLARDLHDAVSQTLFSANVIAEMLPRLWRKHPDRADEYVEGLRLLTKGALAEMRALLVELRPEALLQSDLQELLQQLCHAFTGRTHIAVNFNATGECELPPDVQIVFYRVTQEALNNIAKHAQASRVTLKLERRPGQVALQVSDDGAGFEPANLPTGSFGLTIMAERAESIGAVLSVVSQRDGGTEVTLTWKKH